MNGRRAAHRICKPRLKQLNVAAELVFCSTAKLPAALQVMKLGQLEITDGWMDGEKEVYKFTTRPNVNIPQSLNRYLPGGELVYTGELLRVHCCTYASSCQLWEFCYCACCRQGRYTGEPKICRAARCCRQPPPW